MSDDKEIFENSGKVPVGQKAAFGAGHFVLNLLPGVLRGLFASLYFDGIWHGSCLGRITGWFT